MSKNAVACLIVAAVLGVGGLLAFRTFGTTGQEAIDRMNTEERAFLAKLQLLRRGMSFAQVIEILGRPNEEGPLQMRPKWLIGGNPLNGVAVYIHPEGAHRFVWISIGRFTYEEQLRSSKALQRTSGLQWPHRGRRGMCARAGAEWASCLPLS